MSLEKRAGSVFYCTTGSCGGTCVPNSRQHSQTEEEAEEWQGPGHHGSCRLGWHQRPFGITSLTETCRSHSPLPHFLQGKWPEFYFSFINSQSIGVRDSPESGKMLSSTELKESPCVGLGVQDYTLRRTPEEVPVFLTGIRGLFWGTFISC